MSGYSEIDARFALELYSIYRCTCFCCFLFVCLFVFFDPRSIRNRFDKIRCWPSHCSWTCSWRRKLPHLFIALCAVSFLSLIESQNNRLVQPRSEYENICTRDSPREWQQQNFGTNNSCLNGKYHTISIKKCHKTYKYGKTSKESGALINIRLFDKFNGDRSRLELHFMNFIKLNRITSLKKLWQDFSILFFGKCSETFNLFCLGFVFFFLLFRGLLNT